MLTFPMKIDDLVQLFIREIWKSFDKFLTAIFLFLIYFTVALSDHIQKEKCCFFSHCDAINIYFFVDAENEMKVQNIIDS